MDFGIGGSEIATGAQQGLAAIFGYRIDQKIAEVQLTAPTIALAISLACNMCDDSMTPFECRNLQAFGLQ